MGFLAVDPVSPGGLTRIAYECWVPRYDTSTGARTSADFCADWIPIGK